MWLDPKVSNPSLEKHNLHKATDAGRVKLFIVPQDASAKPVPSLALIEGVETYIRDRASPTINLWVGSPQWLEVSVTAEVVPTSLEVADRVKTNVIQRLKTFLHPLTGGVSGQGWEFGREPHDSDFYALIEAIDGVDYVRSLTIPKLESLPELFLVCSAGNHKIDLFFSDTGV